MNAVAIAVGILALTTLIATNYLKFPHAVLASSVSYIILVIAAIGAFQVAPVVGLSLFLLTAVLFFKRNVDLAAAAQYAEKTIMEAPHKKAEPHATVHSEPRVYSDFAEGFDPVPYGDFAGAPVDGQYPKENARPMETPEGEEYIYRPDPDTGSNTFLRFGPDLDEKMQSFAY